MREFDQSAFLSGISDRTLRVAYGCPNDMDEIPLWGVEVLFFSFFALTQSNEPRLVNRMREFSKCGEQKAERIVVMNKCFSPVLFYLPNKIVLCFAALTAIFFA